MKKLFLIMPILILLCGCFDYTEVNLQNYVMGMSVDYIGGKYRVCIETIKVASDSAESAGVIIKSEGLTVFDAVRDAISVAGKKLYWGHTSLIILGRDVAENHLNSVCDTLSRAQDVYLNVSLAIAPGTAESVICGKTPRDTLMSEHIMNILENEEPSRRFPRCELWQLLRGFDETPIPMVRIEGGYPMVEGSGLIRGGALADTLSGSETQIYLMVVCRADGGYLPRVRVSDKLSVTLEILGCNVHGDIVSLVVALSSCEGRLNVMDARARAEISHAAEHEIKNQIESLGKKITFKENYSVHVTLGSSGATRKTP